MISVTTKRQSVLQHSRRLWDIHTSSSGK